MICVFVRFHILSPNMVNKELNYNSGGQQVFSDQDIDSSRLHDSFCLEFLLHKK